LHQGVNEIFGKELGGHEKEREMVKSEPAELELRTGAVSGVDEIVAEG
jgi:hypothetical protein